MAVTRSLPTATTVTGFVGLIFALSTDPNRILVFRGHPSEDYRLQPSLFRRDEHRDNEENLLRELISSEPGEFSSDQTTFDRLVRMQHYSLPTRLLDATPNPLVALYFATDQVSDSTLSNTGEVIVLSVPKDRLKYYDSDTVSILANLARLSEKERRIIYRSHLTQVKFNETPEVDRLIQFIKDEKPAFRNVINPDDVGKVILVSPKKSNKRIVAQSGMFFIFGSESRLEDCAPGNEIIISRIRVREKDEIRRQLDLLSINGRSLYPEIESAARYIREKFAIPVSP